MKKKDLIKNWPLLIAVVVVAAVTLIVIFSNHASNSQNAQSAQASSNENCGPYRNDKTVTIGITNIEAETANNLAESQKGLAGRPCIPENRAMLFGFTKPGYYAFWMKDMKFPIDIIWIGSDHKVVGAAWDVKPSTYPRSFKNSTPAQYVLEIQANRGKQLNIGYGTLVSF